MSRKYYQVGASAIHRSDFLVSKVKTFSDNRNLLVDIFKKYGIPEKYQKMFFYKNMFSHNFHDFFSNVSFYLRRTNDSKIHAFFKRRMEMPTINYNMYAIYSIQGTCEKEELIKFYKELHEKGLLRNYLRALNEFFTLNMDLDYLFELSDSNKSIRKQKRLYRKRIKMADTDSAAHYE